MNLFSRFAPIIKNLSQSELAGSSTLFKKLELVSTDKIQVCYAPFEYINSNAKIVIVGITPGRQQMLNAIREAKIQIDMGMNDFQVLKSSKSVGAFSGEIRNNLVGLLDYIGINTWLDIPSCSELFGDSASLVQTTSVLRNPVFLQGKDYNGTPKMTVNPVLRDQLLTHFVEDARTLPDAVFVPLGSKVTEALQYLADKGVLNSKQILDGLPHPSPQNIERIRYFMGKKNKDLLSKKTNGDAIDDARSSIINKVQTLI